MVKDALEKIDIPRIAVACDTLVLAIDGTRRNGLARVDLFNEMVSLFRQCVAIVEPDARQKLGPNFSDILTESEDASDAKVFFEKAASLCEQLSRGEHVSDEVLESLQKELVMRSKKPWRQSQIEFHEKRLKRRLKRYG